MKVTRMRKTDITELEAEEVTTERERMEDIDGGTITVKKNNLNSYEEGLLKRNQAPFVVNTLEILIVE